MAENTGGGKEKRNRSYLLVLLVLLLLCLCAATPALARQGGLIGQVTQPIANFTGPLLCGVPPIAAVRIICPNGGPGGSSGGTPEPTLTQESGSTQVPGGSKGACLDPCDPTQNNCEAGLECLPKTQGSNTYICYNSVICNPNGTQGPTQAVSTEPPCVCGDGVCEQARCQEFTQNCPADCGSNPAPTPDPCAKSCGNGVCEPNCGETNVTCPADCG